MKKVIIDINTLFKITVPNVTEEQEQVLADVFKKCKIETFAGNSVKGNSKMLITDEITTKQEAREKLKLTGFLNWV